MRLRGVPSISSRRLATLSRCKRKRHTFRILSRMQELHPLPGQRNRRPRRSMINARPEDHQPIDISDAHLVPALTIIKRRIWDVTNLRNDL